MTQPAIEYHPDLRTRVLDMLKSGEMRVQQIRDIIPDDDRKQLPELLKALVGEGRIVRYTNEHDHECIMLTEREWRGLPGRLV